MKEFLKSVLASAFGTVLALFIGAFLLVVLLVGMASSAGDGQASAHVAVKPKTMLVIGGGLTIEDTPEHGAPGLDELLFGAAGPRLDLLRALEAIDLAAKDKQIAGILLSGELSAGLTQKAEIRRALVAFKKSGKPVIAWVENASQGEYYLASVADKVYAHVSGEVEFKGLASYNMYFGDTLRLAGLGVQVTKVGKYKSAVEPYLGSTMSAEAKEQTEVLMNGLWKRLLADVARSRGLTTERLTKVVESGGIFAARKAVELKLVDAVLHRDELVSRVREAGASADDAGTSFRRVGLHRYAHKVALPSRGGKIAIVYAEGEIVDGWGGAGEIGGDRLAHDLRSIRGDDDFKAVVLRVNSPGGSVSAGLAIYDTMQFIKPDISTICIGMAASMGAVLLAGGVKGKRYMLPNSRAMIHQPWGGFQGQATDISIQAREMLLTRERLNKILASHTGQPIEKIQQDTERDNFMGVEAAIEYGLVDKSLEKRL